MKTYINRITCFASIILLFSCEGFLDRVPLDSPNTATFLSNEEEIKQALNGLYRSVDWRTGQTPFQQHMDLWTDISVETAPGLGSGIFDASDRKVQELWTYAYETVQRANTLIEGMEKGKSNVTETTFLRFQAEAKTLRAFAYFYLTFLFGDIPLITTIQDPEEFESPQVDQTDIIDFLLKDLQDIEKNLPWETEEQGRVTRGFCLGLIARIAFYAKNYELAKQNTLLIINSGIHDLNPNYNKLFTRSGQINNVNNEIMFYYLLPSNATLNTTVPLAQASRNFAGQCNKFPTQRLVDLFECTDGKRIDESSVYDPNEPSKNRDKRLKWTVTMHGDTIPGNFVNGKAEKLCIYNSYDKVTNIFDTNTDTWSTTNNNDVTNPFGPVNSGVGYLWSKYSFNDEPLTNAKVGWIFMRYADILLMYAESKIELGEIDELVINSINRLRNRGELPNLSPETINNIDNLKKTIRRERTSELALEGFRWFDLRRWGIADKVMPGSVYGASKSKNKIAQTPNFKISALTDLFNIPDYSTSHDDRFKRDNRIYDKKLSLLPIPQREIDINKNLTQNPGW